MGRYSKITAKSPICSSAVTASTPGVFSPAQVAGADSVCAAIRSRVVRRRAWHASPTRPRSTCSAPCSMPSSFPSISRRLLPRSCRLARRRLGLAKPAPKGRMLLRAPSTPLSLAVQGPKGRTSRPARSQPAVRLGAPGRTDRTPSRRRRARPLDPRALRGRVLRLERSRAPEGVPPARRPRTVLLARSARREPAMLGPRARTPSCRMASSQQGRLVHAGRTRPRVPSAPWLWAELALRGSARRVALFAAQAPVALARAVRT